MSCNDVFLCLHLKSLGTPCIIRASLNPDEITKYFQALASKIETVYLQSTGIVTSNNAPFDANMKKALPANQVLKIISANNPEFEALTRHHTWSIGIDYC